MGNALRAIHVSTEERYFTCRYCGAKGEVRFIAVGDSGYQTGSLLADVEPDDADVVAEEAQMVDADRIANLIKCPTCKRRNAAYFRWLYIRIVLWFAGAALAVWLYSFMEPDIVLLVAWAGLCAGGIWQAWRERGRLTRADAARILRLKPGKHAGLADANPVHTLPVAIATEKPRPPKVIAPVEAKPVERVAQRGADEEPAFLRKD